jgi:ATP-dependent RNA helicase DDX23/PRP28
MSQDAKPVFLTKKQREELALQRLEEKRKEDEKKSQATKTAYNKFVTGKSEEEKKDAERLRLEKERQEKERRKREENIDGAEQEYERKMINEHYFGRNEPKKVVKPSEKFTRVFQFEWKADDDTGKDDLNPLYNKRMKINALFGRGYIAGVDQREQRKESNFLLSLSEKRMVEARALEDADKNLTEGEKAARAVARQNAMEEFKRRQSAELQHGLRDDGMGKHWTEKRLEEMTDRDWRIFREDFDIRIQGGRATLPLRYWQESTIAEPILKAIGAAGYEKPSPIQRQTIPIGLANKDIIGIAETGSGKTCAFLVPMLSYIMKLPKHYVERSRDQGPLAVIMAPTRELALQIEEECIKLARFTNLKTLSVVGGQAIEDQGFRLSEGVEIVIGTPGRMIDCIKNNYLVLNQCNYVILDEADRMIDMGFEDQVIAVLDAMGGLLKSEDEELAELQVQSASTGKVVYRVTAMFSATMAPEVESIAKKYLRHPVIVKIGDEDTGKNKRIEQLVYVISENQKKNKLIEELKKLSVSENKVIIFVNSKKAGDSLSYQLDNINYKTGLLHGGKSQDQREETLEFFRNGKYNILVATDVAARGLDIPDVSHVINYDCPNKIEPYCHRIGRTGRAGKFGIAITFLTESDTEIMYDLKNYLESTGANVPQLLAHNPSAQGPANARDEKGRLLNSKKDSVLYAN